MGIRQRSGPAAVCVRPVLHAALRLYTLPAPDIPVHGLRAQVCSNYVIPGPQLCGWRCLLQVVEAVQADLADKVDAGELRRLLEGKAGVEDVNAALLEVCHLSCQGGGPCASSSAGLL